ncbi:hypothetical protein AB0K86_00640 [Streptomyces clavifer]|uniref:hypothetical protein n=1 Tax=Streptomyces TaxID=1883 RepID=UPI0006F1E0CE|nr:MULTISPECIES: hypothetical protein [unclassified Streptomyces]KQX86185.1 hypothetical protein ASD26_26870 [Streptomyces sp. Root1319]KQZ17089.1 hypothetical protein ASD51_05025 [Streptomyces sp. Root55]
MDLAPLFAGLDAQPWATYQHAYGSAADVPDCLRALVDEDDEQAGEALGELYGSILHQGSVYEATAHAVPYLARLARAGFRTADVLALLGGIAEGGADEGEGDEAACRRAVTAQLPLLLASVEAGSADVRRAAVWAAAMTGATERVRPVLRTRFATEAEPLVRAEILGGLAHLDPAGTADLAAGAIGPDGPGELRVAALLACVDAGAPWFAAHHEAMLDLLPADELVAARMDLERNEPLRYVVSELLLRDTDTDRDAVFRLLDAALRSERSEARTEALWAAESACQISRSAPDRVAGPLAAAVLEDPEAVGQALSLLRLLGRRAAAVAPALADVAEGDGDLADRALEALVSVAPEQAVPLLTRDLENRPRALGAACGGLLGASPTVPFDAGLLAAVRARLAAPEKLRDDEPFRYAVLLSSWGHRAAPALPELGTALRMHPQPMARALAAVCPPDHREATGGLLRRAARSGPPEARLAAARAVWQLTEDAGPLLGVLAEQLTDGGRVREAATAAAGLGPRAAELVPALVAAASTPGASRVIPHLDADVAIAEALWRITGRAEEALRLLAGVLGETGLSWIRWTFVRAARVAARLGDEGRPLVPELEKLLTDPLHTPAAVLALHTIAPGTLDVRAAAGLLLDSAEDDADAATALEALLALGPDALTEDHARRLTALAERDLRVTASGVETTIAATDDRLREQAGQVLRALGAGPTAAGA